MDVIKSKVMVLGGEGEIMSDIKIQGGQMEQMQEFKYLECMVNDKGINVVEYENKLMSGRTVAGAIRALVDMKRLKLVYAKCYTRQLILTLLCGNKTMVWKEREVEDKSSLNFNWIT